MTPQSERRRFRRVSLADPLHSVMGRIRPGLSVRVLDLSSGGGLIETTARLLPGATVDLHLEARDTRAPIRARVVRCCVGRVSAASIIFTGALQFDAPLTSPFAGYAPTDDTELHPPSRVARGVESG